MTLDSRAGSNLVPCPALTAFPLGSRFFVTSYRSKVINGNFFHFSIIMNYILFAKEKAAKRIKHLELHGHNVSGLKSRKLNT